MTQPLITEQLVEQARRRTGLKDFDTETFREGLGILLADWNEQEASEAAAERFGTAIVDALCIRLQVNDYLAARPELLRRPIKRPVFVFGIPRTGTTLLSNLLAADPARQIPADLEN